jgi:glycosyltransferase involved in cell wall biosynthesis
MGKEDWTDSTPNQETPLASVLLPVHNGEKYLAKAIDSVLRQTLASFELLLLDDGSTDGSRAIMQSFVAADSRCRLFCGPNRGIVAALNAGLEAARGAFVFRMDADDVCEPTRFEKQLDFFARHPDHIAVGSRVRWIDPEGMPLRTAVDCFVHNAIDANNLRGNHVIYHSAVAIRTDGLKHIGGYREGFKHAEDLDLFLRLGEAGKLANLSEVLLSYRQHMNSVSMLHTGQQRESGRKAIEAACARRRIPVESVLGAYVPPPTRPRWELHRIWGWSALQSGYVATARKHAIRALRSQPLSPKNWVLAACALRGR